MGSDCCLMARARRRRWAARTGARTSVRGAAAPRLVSGSARTAGGGREIARAPLAGRGLRRSRVGSGDHDLDRTRAEVDAEEGWTALAEPCRCRVRHDRVTSLEPYGPGDVVLRW